MKSTPPSAETHPNLFAWYCLVMKFTDAVKSQWGGKGADKKAGGKKEAAKKEDDDMDLFGDDDEVDEVSLLFNRKLDINIQYRKLRRN